MKLANPFSVDTRELFRDVWSCAICGMNGQERGGLSLHHILSRISASPLGASVLCGFCHGKVGHTEEEHIKLLTHTLVYLKSQHYKFNEADFSFIRKNSELFKKVLK